MKSTFITEENRRTAAPRIIPDPATTGDGEASRFHLLSGPPGPPPRPTAHVPKIPPTGYPANMLRRLARLALPAALAANLSCNRLEDCKCGSTEYGLRTLPGADAVDVPTNTRIWGTDVESLHDDKGVAVPVARTSITDSEDSSEFTVLHPLKDLAPNTTYTITTSFGTQEFTTSAGPLTTPPPVPEIEELEQERSRDCGGKLYRATYILRGSGAVFLLDTAETAILAPEDIAGDVTAFANGPVFRLGATCGGFENVPSAPTRNSTTTVRFSSFDLAGNFSGWSEPEELTFGGCNLGGSSSPPSLALLPLLLLRRRRRAHG